MDPDIEKRFIAYCIGKKMLAISTAKTYLQAIKILNRQYSDLSLVTHENIIDYLSDLRIKRNLNPNSRRNIKVALETFFKWYSAWAGFQNPAIGLSPIKEYKSFPKLVHPDEIERMCFYEHKKNTEHSMRNAAIIAVFFMFGPRVGEFERLKLGNITRKSDHFTVLIPAIKGTYERIVQFGKFIPGTIIDYFNRYYLWITTQKMQKKTNPLFFKLNYRKLHQEDMTKPVLRSSVNHILEQAAFCADIDRLITPHQLRHAYATYSIIEGINPLVLQQNMGHARFETTQKYIHIAGLISDETLKHSPASKVKSSPELSGYTKLMKDLNKYID